MKSCSHIQSKILIDRDILWKCICQLICYYIQMSHSGVSNKQITSCYVCYQATIILCKHHHQVWSRVSSSRSTFSDNDLINLWIWPQSTHQINLPVLTCVNQFSQYANINQTPRYQQNTKTPISRRKFDDKFCKKMLMGWNACVSTQNLLLLWYHHHLINKSLFQGPFTSFKEGDPPWAHPTVNRKKITHTLGWVERR